jgi:alpha-N-arabinofuranosidase
MSFLSTVLAIMVATAVGASVTVKTDVRADRRAKVSVQPNRKIGRIDPDIYGHFAELVYHCFYGGLWAEMLESRKFEGDDGDHYGVVKPWYPIGRTANTHFMHDNTNFYSGNQSQKIVSWERAGHRVGLGQKGLYIEQGKTYAVRLNLRHAAITTPLVVTLEGERGVYAARTISLPDTGWNRSSFTLRPSETDRNGSFTLTFTGSGTLWIGTASLMSGDHLSGYRKDVIEALRVIKPPNLRWPGGNFVSYYRWEDGIGDRDKRPSRLNYSRALEGEGKYWEPNDVGLDEFMELCRLIETKPYPAVNAGDGTPEEAAHLVEYCNGPDSSMYGAKRVANGHPTPYGIELWGIGNEMFGNWQGGHVDEETYARRHLAIARAMRAVDPKIKLVASGARYWKYPRWNQALLKIGKGYVDYLSLHSYAKRYRSHMKKEDLKDPQFAKEFYYYIVSSPYGIEEEVNLTGKEIRETQPYGPRVAVAYDEWNAWAYRAPLSEVDFALRDGIYTAGVFHAFRRQWDVVKLANFSMTVNTLGLIRTNRLGMFFNPQYLAFQMYMNHQGPLLVQSSVACETFPAPEYELGRPQAIGRIAYLDASATVAEAGDTLYLAVINLHDSQNIIAEISLEGWEPKPRANIAWLDGDHYMAENTFEKPANVTIKERQLEGATNHMSYEFPSHSVTILELYKK